MGGTEYWLSMIPCGGYVLPAMDDEEAFDNIPLRRRILFALAGPAANILGAFVCLSLMNIVELGCSVGSAIYLPLEQIWQMTIQIGSAIPMLFSQPEHLSGIVGIVAMGGAHVGLSFVRLLQFSVLLNLNFAVFNLLPIPMLDGGQILVLAIDKVMSWFGRTLSMVARERIQLTGLAVILVLMVFVLFLDFSHIF